MEEKKAGLRNVYTQRFLETLILLHFVNYPLDIINFLIITKTCLHNFDPLKPHFYIVKLGFTGVYIIFLITA